MFDYKRALSISHLFFFCSLFPSLCPWIFCLCISTWPSRQCPQNLCIISKVLYKLFISQIHFIKMLGKSMFHILVFWQNTQLVVGPWFITKSNNNTLRQQYHMTILTRLFTPIPSAAYQTSLISFLNGSSLKIIAKRQVSSLRAG